MGPSDRGYSSQIKGSAFNDASGIILGYAVAHAAKVSGEMHSRHTTPVNAIPLIGGLTVIAPCLVARPWYGWSIPVPWGKVFGASHDGTELSHVQFVQRRRRLTGVVL